MPYQYQKKKAGQVLKALEGHYKESGLFELRQAYEAYEFYQARIGECDQRMEQVLEKIHVNQEQAGKKNGKRKAIRHNKPKIADLGWHLLEIFGGIDATQLSDITDYTWLQLYTEVGSDLTK